MITTYASSPLGGYFLFWQQKPLRLKLQRTKLIDVLSSQTPKNESDSHPRTSPLIDPPQKTILVISTWVLWVPKRIIIFVRVLATETQELVAQLRNPDVDVKANRFWEVDLLRGVTVSLMVLIHTIPLTASMAFLVIPLVIVRLLFYALVAVALIYWGVSLPIAGGKDLT